MAKKNVQNTVSGNTLLGGSRASKPLMSKSGFSLQAMPSRGRLSGMSRRDRHLFWGGVPPSYGAPEEEELEFERRAPSQSPQSAAGLVPQGGLSEGGVSAPAVPSRIANPHAGGGYGRMLQQEQGIQAAGQAPYSPPPFTGGGDESALTQSQSGPLSRPASLQEAIQRQAMAVQAGAMGQRGIPSGGVTMNDIADRGAQVAHAEQARASGRGEQGRGEQINAIRNMMPSLGRYGASSAGPESAAPVSPGNRRRMASMAAEQRGRIGEQPIQPAEAQAQALANRRQAWGQQDYTSDSGELLEQYKGAQVKNWREGKTTLQSPNTVGLADQDTRRQSMKANDEARRKAYWEQDAANNRAEFNDIATQESADFQRRDKEMERQHGQEMDVAMGGSLGYQVGQEGGDREDIASGKRRDANEAFAMSGNASMGSPERMAMYGRMAEKDQLGGREPADATLADRQALAKAYGERGVGEGRTMVNQEENSLDYGRTALTSRGNTNRFDGGISSQSRTDKSNGYFSDDADITGQIEHKGQMISARTAPEYRDAAARNRERIDSRRAARGGLSERQMRDISRRAGNPKALQAYALRNGLDKNPMVNRLLNEATGGRKNSRGETVAGQSHVAERKDNYSSSEQHEAQANLPKLYSGPFATDAGLTEGDSIFDTGEKIMNRESVTMTDLTEWSAIHEERRRGENNKYDDAGEGMEWVSEGYNELSDLVDKGKEKEAMAKYAELKKKHAAHWEAEDKTVQDAVKDTNLFKF